MPNIINADNGLVSGSVGLKYSCDNTGVLALQTSGNTAMTIDGSGNVGIGTSSPGNNLTVEASSSGYGISVYNTNSNSVLYMAYKNISAPTAINNGSQIDLSGLYSSVTPSAFATYGRILGAKENATAENYAGYLALSTRPNGGSLTERMRIDSSGNVGIGTTSPTDTAGFTRALDLNGASGAALYTRTNGSATSWTAFGNYGVDGYVNNRGAGSLLFFNNNAERMRIDSGGSVGIGNSIPGSFNAFANQLVVGNGSSSQGITIYASNASSISFADGTVGAASYQGYIQYSHPIDAMDFFVNYAGSSSPRMRIDSSGNVGIGTSSPLAKFEVHGQSRFASSGSSAVLLIDAAATSTNGVDIQSSYYGGAGYGPMKFTTSGQERMRIVSGGQVLINTTTTGSILTVDTKQSNYTDGIDLVNSTNWGYGTSINFRVPPTSGGSLATVSRIQQFYEASNQYGLGFSTYNAGLTERMRITSGGSVLIGSTSENAKLFIASSGAGATIRTDTNANSYAGYAIYSVLNGSSNNNTTARHFAGYTNGPNDVFIVYGNGNVVNQNNSYGSISDIKLKENIVDATPKLEKLNQVRIVTYNLIGEEQKQIGVIAQELEQIFPSMVDESPDQDKDGNDLGTTTKSIKYSVFIPMLIKAIQEQQAMIEELKQEVALLKSKE